LIKKTDYGILSLGEKTRFMISLGVPREGPNRKMIEAEAENQ
jgi:hypothetical protein